MTTSHYFCLALGLAIGLTAALLLKSWEYREGREVGRREMLREVRQQKRAAIEDWYAAIEPGRVILPPPYTTPEVLDREVQAERHGPY